MSTFAACQSNVLIIAVCRTICIRQSAPQLAELFRVLSASTNVCVASVEAASSCSPLASSILDKMAGKTCVQQWMQTAPVHADSVSLQEACQ